MNKNGCKRITFNHIIHWFNYTSSSINCFDSKINAMVKVDKLNGLFDIIDTTTEAISSFGDYFITGIASKIGKIFKKKGKDKDE